MRMAMIGLGKMGGNMVRRLRRDGIEVVGYDRTADGRRRSGRRNPAWSPRHR